MAENFEFAYRWVFFLAPLPLLVYWLLPPIKSKSSSLTFPYFNRAAEVSGEKPSRSAQVKGRGFLPWLALSSIWLLLLAAVASPQLVGKPEKKVKLSRNFLIVADLSFSMAQNDWTLEGKRVSRWDAVKDIMKDFVVRRKSDRLGLVFFASNAYVQAPFTNDLSTVRTMLDEADVGMAGQATNIGKAIVKGMDLFERDTIPNKVMLLLTDGVDSGQEILPLDAANLAKKDSTVIYTIGIGKPGTSGSDLDERTLEEIAEMTGGSYFRAADADALEKVYTQLDTLEPVEYEEESYVPRTLLYYYPLGAALGLGILATTLNLIILLFKNLRKTDG